MNREVAGKPTEIIFLINLKLKNHNFMPLLPRIFWSFKNMQSFHDLSASALSILHWVRQRVLLELWYLHINLHLLPNAKRYGWLIQSNHHCR